MSGYVYAVKNPSMPGLVKIGQTGDMSKRLESLFDSSVPTPFETVCVEEVDNPKAIESRLHKYFESSRVSEKREFFRVDADEVKPLFELLPRTLSDESKLSISIPDVGTVYADSLKSLYKLIQKLKLDRIPAYPSVVDRKSKKWTLEEIFNFEVPPRYRKVDRWVKDKGFEYYPHKPYEEIGMKRPVVHHQVKRVYITQQFFADENNIPADYVSDKLKSPCNFTAQEIIDMYQGGVE